MDGKNTLGLLKDSQQLLMAIYGDLAQPSVKKVGIALETVIEFSTSVFLPLKFQSEKWKINFDKRLNDYKNKLDKISEEDIIEVNPQIGVPLIDRLAYTTNDDVAEMFLNLLTKASSIKTVSQAHPSFINIIERISSDEAKIINHLENKSYIPYISYRLYRKGTEGYITTLNKATLLQFELDLLFSDNVSIYLDNLITLGIIGYEEKKFKGDFETYETLFKKYHFENIKNELSITLDDFDKLERVKSFYEVTDYGKAFIRSCTNKNI